MISAERASTTTMAFEALDPDDLLRAVRGSVLRVRSTGCGEVATGSAWLGPSYEVFTNRHVVERSETVELLTWNGIDLLPTLMETSSTLDVARLAGDWRSRDLEPLKIRTDPLAAGERIAIVGFPLGQELSISTGVVVGYEPAPEGPPIDVLKTTTVVQPGNSGGPALDMSGAVVGVVFAEEVATDEALVIPIDDVLSLADFRVESGCN